MLNATQAKQVAPLTVAVPLLQARLGPKLQQAQPGPRRAEEQVVPQPVQNRLAGQTGVHRRVDPAPVAHRRQSTSADQVRLKSPCVHYLCRFANTRTCSWKACITAALLAMADVLHFLLRACKDLLQGFVTLSYAAL